MWNQLQHKTKPLPKKETYRVIISGGGTGGHIYPAIAIANTLKELLPQVEILFVGALGRMEMEKVPRAGFEIIGLPIAGIQRRLTLENLKFPFKLLKSMRMAKKIVKEFNPDVAVGVGGYASGPLLKAAGKLGVPTVLQEQNSYAGVTNKWLAKAAKKICVAYPGMEKFFPGEKLVVTGNPVRKELLNAENLKEEGKKHFGIQPGPTVLVIGGSLGARTINNAVGQQLDSFRANGVQLLWQTGRFYYEEAAAKAAPYQDAGVQAHEFIYDMDKAYAAADVVISRAGALSISELCLVGKPCVLVPSPNVAEDHQTKNAMALVNRGAAKLVKDHEAAGKLCDVALELIKNENEQQVLIQKIKELGKPQASNDIGKVIIEVMETE